MDQTAVDCLAAAIYYEATGEGETGQRAVAQVVLNRVRHPAFPASICGVVYEGAELRTGCQFTFTCDGSLLRKPSARGWANARRIAVQALQGKVEPTIGTATHYHANYVLPYWAPTLDKVAAINTHIFYRWGGSWGKRRAFTQAYAGEPGGAPYIEAAPVLEGELGLQGSGATVTFSEDRLPQMRMQTPELLTEAVRSPKLRADENKGTLKVDGVASELAINSAGTMATADFR